LGQRGGQHVRGLAGRGKGLDRLGDPEAGIPAGGRRDLPVLVLGHQHPGELLAQARQVLAHPAQARHDLANVIQAREVQAVRGQLAQGTDRPGRLGGGIARRHRGGQLRSGGRPAAGERGGLGVIGRAVGANPSGHLSPVVYSRRPAATACWRVLRHNARERSSNSRI